MESKSSSLLLRLDELTSEVKLGESTIKQKVKDGNFPKPIKIGARAMAWKRSDIEGWIDTLSRASDCGGHGND